MVRPAHFGFNSQTAENNAFQTNDDRLTIGQIETEAKIEFDLFVATLRSNGIEVLVYQDTDQPLKTDAVFPNNWVTFHPNGCIITYPMFAPIRRLERREDIVEDLAQRFGFDKRMRLERYEKDSLFLEGTGSLIPDRDNKIVYACVSPRTSPVLVKEYCKITGYEEVLFMAVDEEGTEIYHTNVMMAVGETFVVICLDTIQSQQEREMLLQKFEATGKEVIDITLDQMKAFAGNMLQVRNKNEETFLVMSQQAFESLRSDQITLIEQHTNILYSSIKIIETYGGGSARCMMAEVFLPE